jgi:ribosome-associated protein
MGQIQVTPLLALDENELRWIFMRSSGPGGQHVNKVSTAVQLRFDVMNSPSIPDNIRARLLRMAANMINDDGIMVINARRFRSQFRNRQDALERLIDVLREATIPPKTRRRTKPTAASKRRRLQAKRRRSALKRLRRRVTSFDD